MEYITTTQLRTNSSQLVKSLKRGGTVSLIHRSKVIGAIKPAQASFVTITDIADFRKALHAAKLRKLIPKSQREKIYRKRLEEKYGKGIS